MNEMFGGIVGGLGLFLFGMWLLTENLKALAGRRLRQIVHRWTGKRYTALLWGMIAGGVTQSMSGLIFIVVSILRSRLITKEGALALVLGGSIGCTFLVMIVTLDVRAIALYVLGIAGIVAATERFSGYRLIASSFLGGAMVILGLVLLKESAAPLAREPWFRELVEQSGNSLLLAFLTAAALAFVIQSSGAVTVFAISLATVGVVSVDQAIMMIYGSCAGSGLVIYVLSASLTGNSRQIPMYMVLYNFLVSALLVVLLYCEIYLEIPSVKAVVFSVDLGLDQRLAMVYVIFCVLPVPVFLAALAPTARVLERFWPAGPIEKLSQTRFIHDHATVDVETSLILADLEQKRLFANFSRYFDAVRHRTALRPVREASRTVLSEVSEFLNELQYLHPVHGVELRNAQLNRQKLLSWLDNSTAAVCEALLELDDRLVLGPFKEGVCEGVDTVFLTMVEAMVDDDPHAWEIASRMVGDRGALMRRFRREFLEMDPPLKKRDMLNVLLVTNAVEEVFFLLSRLEAELNPAKQE